MPSPRPVLRDAQLAAALDRDGYVVARGFLSAPEQEALMDVFRRCDSPLHRSPFGVSARSEDLEYRAAVDRGIRAVLEPRVDEVLEDYRCCFGNFLTKEPSPAGAGELPIHQDPTVVDESRYEAIAFWCPLVDTDEVNGCVHVVPGSHRFNSGPRAPGVPYPYRALDPLFRKAGLRPVPVRAGDLMIFSQKLFHASPPNRGRASRIVAGALLVPREAQLYCLFPDADDPARLEIFAVDDAFYTRYHYGVRPEGVPRVGFLDYRFDPITPGQLAR